MITDQNPKEYFDSISGAPENQKPFRLVLFILFVTISGWVAREIRNSQLIDKLQEKNDELNITINTNTKDCQTAVLKERNSRDSIWSAKVDQLQEKYNSDLKERAEKWDNSIDKLTRKVEKKLNR